MGQFGSGEPLLGEPAPPCTDPTGDSSECFGLESPSVKIGGVTGHSGTSMMSPNQ